MWRIVFSVSERELTSTVHVPYMLSSVRLSVVCSLSVVCNALVHPTKRVEIFGNVSTPFGTLDIRLTFTKKSYGDHPRETPPSGR